MSILLKKRHYEIANWRDPHDTILTLGEFPIVNTIGGKKFPLKHSCGRITPEEIAHQAKDALDPEYWLKFCAGEDIEYRQFYSERGVYLVKGTILPLSLSFAFISAMWFTP